MLRSEKAEAPKPLHVGTHCSVEFLKAEVLLQPERGEEPGCRHQIRAIHELPLHDFRSQGRSGSIWIWPCQGPRQDLAGCEEHSKGACARLRHGRQGGQPGLRHQVVEGPIDASGGPPQHGFQEPGLGLDLGIAVAVSLCPRRSPRGRGGSCSIDPCEIQSKGEKLVNSRIALQQSFALEADHYPGGIMVMLILLLPRVLVSKKRT
mmetsp:Transcript_84957/g.177565  ORF Transcript_84957/g.177565 Transcript_84957/m.177565 type:complete len:206 (+) Transcript_84957:1089-1706(+)